MRRLLGGLYAASERMAMAALAAIAMLVVFQVLARLLDTILGWAGHAPLGLMVPSLAEIAGFLLIAASFLGLAGSFRSGSQIRVTLALGQMPPAWRRPVEIAVLTAASALMIFFFWYCALLVYDSLRFGEVSYGILVIPLWIPQAAMALGAAVFAIALLDDLISLVARGTASYIEHEADAEGRGE